MTARPRAPTGPAQPSATTRHRFARTTLHPRCILNNYRGACPLHLPFSVCFALQHVGHCNPVAPTRTPCRPPPQSLAAPSPPGSSTTLPTASLPATAPHASLHRSSGTRCEICTLRLGRWEWEGRAGVVVGVGRGRERRCARPEPRAAPQPLALVPVRGQRRDQRVQRPSQHFGVVRHVGPPKYAVHGQVLDQGEVGGQGRDGPRCKADNEHVCTPGHGFQGFCPHAAAHVVEKYVHALGSGALGDRAGGQVGG